MEEEPSRQRQRERVKLPLPSIEALKKIIRRAGELGSITWSPWFKQRCSLRGFTTMDAINVLRHGEICSHARFDMSRRAWRIELVDTLDGCNFVVDVGLSCDDDYLDSPRVEIVTAFYRRGARRKIHKERENNDDKGDDA
jgi:hypothetical protein